MTLVKNKKYIYRGYQKCYRGQVCWLVHRELDSNTVVFEDGIHKSQVLDSFIESVYKLVTETKNSKIQVMIDQETGLYDIASKGKVRHEKLTANDAMMILMDYIPEHS